ncbi:GTPase IMAP family member 9-like [Garra rufa]|uniref:GTPase IMAP family member 9-like n=1 Tax=Garra rufa TaxID=137080 RepID=UPI003CCEF1B1
MQALRHFLPKRPSAVTVSSCPKTASTPQPAKPAWPQLSQKPEPGLQQPPERLGSTPVLSAKARPASSACTSNYRLSIRRVVLVGKTGAGKSSSGNTILGKKAFRAAKSASSVTKECWKETGNVAGREITLVDTPGLFDTGVSEDHLKLEISKCINMTTPGPHAIILVIKLGPFTEEERLSVEKIRAIFGEEADKHTIILFTHADELTSTIEQYISGAKEDLKEILNRCGGRYHVFNNKDMEDRNQVLQLLKIVDDMVTAHGGGFYSSKSYQNIEARLKTTEEELLKLYEKKLQDKERELESRFTEEKKKMLETIETLTTSNQEKERKINELQALDKKRNYEMMEFQRYYEAMCKQVRQEAELICISEDELIGIITQLKTLKCTAQ